MIWLRILVATAALVLLFRCVYLFVVKRIGHSIERRHRALEHVIETRQPPPAWLGARPRQAEDIKASCVKRLDELQSYVSKSALVADEQTREELVGRLQAVRQEWLQSPLPPIDSRLD